MAEKGYILRYRGVRSTRTICVCIEYKLYVKERQCVREWRTVVRGRRTDINITWL